MTKKVRVYSNFLDQAEDEFNEGLFNFVFNHGWRCAKWFFIVSSPVFLIGTAIAPAGTPRLEHGGYLVGKQHEFLWGYLGGGIKNTGNALGAVLGPVLDNGASDNE